MSSPSLMRIDSIRVEESLSAKRLFLDSGAIDDSLISANANIQASKLQNRFNITGPMNGNYNTNVAAARFPIYVCHSPQGGTLNDFGVAAVTAAIGAATCVWDLLKNGTTILSAQITLDNATAAYALKHPAGFTSLALVLGDVVEVQIVSATAGGGTLAKGGFYKLVTDENCDLA